MTQPHRNFSIMLSYECITTIYFVTFALIPSFVVSTVLSWSLCSLTRLRYPKKRPCGQRRKNMWAKRIDFRCKKTQPKILISISRKKIKINYILLPTKFPSISHNSGYSTLDYHIFCFLSLLFYPCDFWVPPFTYWIPIYKSSLLLFEWYYYAYVMSVFFLIFYLLYCLRAAVLDEYFTIQFYFIPAGFIPNAFTFKREAK